jgi:hypothetical protein
MFDFNTMVQNRQYGKRFTYANVEYICVYDLGAPSDDGHVVMAIRLDTILPADIVVVIMSDSMYNGSKENVNHNQTSLES